MSTKFFDDKFTKLLREVFWVTKMAEERYYDQNLDETDNYLFLGLSKTNKIVSSLLQLYPKLDELPDLEFSIGILLRSTLMDSIQVLHLIHLVQVGVENGNSVEQVSDTLRECCYKYNCDGTKYIINEIDSQTALTDTEKKDLMGKCTAPFRRAFKSLPSDGSKPKFDRSFTFKLNELYEQAKESNIARFPAVYGLYCLYSKYDHLSYWTGQAELTDFATKTEYLQAGIEMVLMHLRDMLFVSLVNSNIKLEDLYNRTTDYITKNILENVG